VTAYPGACRAENFREGIMAMLVRVALVFAALVSAGPSVAQTPYPSRPVRIVVPFAAAGPTDLVARIIATKLSDSLGKQFYVENLPQGAGNPAMVQVAKAPPDGYTIMVHGSSLIVNSSIYVRAPFDPYTDFAPVTLAGIMPNVILSHPSVPAKNIKELIDVVNAQPGKFSYGHSGIGTIPHLAGELFKLTFGLDIATIPFNGAGQAVQAIVGGHTPISFLALPPIAPNVQQGQVRALAILSKQRSPVIPDVQTMAEQGYPDQESDALTGVVAPPGTPKEIIDLLHREIVKAMTLPDVRERLNALGFQSIINTPEEYAAYIKVEVPRWGKVVRTANIRIE